ncbi:MAG: ABC transporter ATP-binding protein [Clostridia bacterium]|nr:ABC transporter ATP-binding protein [Clostridia bacterium]
MERYSVSVRDLAVGYDGKPVLRNVSFDIGQGEIVTLIGPNGGGKSTLLRSIVRQLETLAGTVEINGRLLNSISARDLARQTAVVLTDRIRPEMTTCREIAAMGRYPYTGPIGILSKEDEMQVDAALKAVEMSDYAQRDFNAVSDGQRQRVLIARAICQQPKIIVLDEPTSFLDIRHKLELLSLLRRMAREQGITILMSLHEIDLAQKISDKILCVENGRPVRFGTPEELFTEDGIRSLYELENGCYDPLFGAVELPGAQGRPQVFVLSSGGTGIPVYRKLAGNGIPFAAGILYTNDLDCHLAHRLACEVVTEEAFCPISDPACARAMALIREVPRVIDAGVKIGPCNSRIRDLILEAKTLGKYGEA